MRVLVGCEESGKVRDAFIAKGHDAWSCDLVLSRNGGPHLQMDVSSAICREGPWDIIILHPPCTALAVSGNRWYGHGKPGYMQRLEAISWISLIWFQACWHAKLGAALENPVGVIWPAIKNYIPNSTLSYIQPWQFGHGEVKKTGILTHKLPPLIPTNIVDGREPKVWKMAPGINRKRDRSETYQGIADAMAKQWG